MALASSGGGGGTSAVVELNVGGVLYTTTEQTLGPLLKTFGDTATALKDSKGRLFLDRDGVLFRLILIIAFGLVQSNHAARILAYFPTPGKSHHYFFTPILRELGRRGHVVDYYSPFKPASMHPNVNYVELENMMPVFIKNAREPEDAWFEKILPRAEKVVVKIHRLSVRLAKKLSATTAVKDLLKSTVKYDLLLHEGFIMMEHGHVFAHKFNVSTVTLLSVGDLFNVNEFTGLVSNTAYMVNSLSSTVTDRMGFVDRLHNEFWNGIFYPVVYNGYLNEVQSVIDECFTYPGWESRASLKEMMSDQALVLANSHHAVGYAFPKAPHYKEIGGAVLQPSKPLPQDLEKFINDSTKGVIYFSLGTIVDLDIIDSNLKHVFTRVFATRKERILWKWSGKPLQNVSDNVKVMDFVPQQDLLGHGNIKLFITHSGMQSSFEAVHFGVPLVIMPYYADQMKNGLALQQAGYGVMLEPKNVTDESLSWAIDETIGNPSYKERVLKGSAQLRDRPLSPVDEAVYWIEYVLRNGKVLQPVGAKLSYIQLHCLDVYTFFFFILGVVYFLSKKLLRVLRQRRALKRKED